MAWTCVAGDHEHLCRGGLGNEGQGAGQLRDQGGKAKEMLAARQRTDAVPGNSLDARCYAASAHDTRSHKSAPARSRGHISSPLDAPVGERTYAPSDCCYFGAEHID